MHTATSIVIHAAREKIFEAVHRLSRWPEVLPHYRYVRTLRQEGARAIVKMACFRTGIPVAWTSAYDADPATLELHFEHLRGWTKGMKVVWKLTATGEGTLVEIVHDLHFRVPALAWLAEPIIGGFFIDHVARKTLSVFKAHIESSPA
ncbi:MAG TPA: SRPBCC family protein [Chthoniobacteraceae bacterium]|nr:SRPBCC family protein [Chthoniobacteraceae bacterium]